MTIKLSLGPGRPFIDKEIEPGTTAEDLYREMKAECPYRIMAAAVDNEIRPLNTALKKSCRVQLLDIRNKQAYLIMQNTLIIMLVKAAREILEPVHVEVLCSLNDGLFVQIMQKNEAGSLEQIEVSEDDTARIYFYMKSIVEKDLPIEAHHFSKKKAIELLKGVGLEEKYRNLQHLRVDETVRIYTLDGYSDYFYNYMAPSTGYSDQFELMKYRDGLLMRHPKAEEPDRIPDYVDEYKMYNALKEQRHWNDLLGIQYQADINDRIASGDYKTMIQLSEALHDKKVVEIADQIVTAGKRVVLILGPSSSGKTTFAKRLIIQLMVNGKKSLYIGTDDYFVEREQTPVDENGKRNYENIDALDLPLFNQQMNELLNGETVDMPVFNFKTGHKEYGKRITRIDSDDLIVIEGIHAFNHLLTQGLDESLKFKIYISPLTQINLDSHNRIPTTDIRAIRRIVRDSWSRAHTAAMTLRLWPQVRAGEDKNIFPFSSEADAFFNTVHVYEMNVLKKHAVPLLKVIQPDEEEYAEAQRLLRLFEYVKSLDDESIIAQNSILREFIGGSVYE